MQNLISITKQISQYKTNVCTSYSDTEAKHKAKIQLVARSFMVVTVKSENRDDSFCDDYFTLYARHDE